MTTTNACSCCEAVMDAARTFLQGRGDNKALADLAASFRSAKYQVDDPPGKVSARGKNHLANHPSSGSPHLIELTVEGGKVTGSCLGENHDYLAVAPPGFLLKLARFFGILKSAA